MPLEKPTSESPRELNLRLLQAFGIECPDTVVSVVLELRPGRLPSLVVKRVILRGGDVIHQLERMRLTAVCEEDMPPVWPDGDDEAMSNGGVL